MKGKIFQHTSKAVKRGCPAERVFTVVGIADDDPKYLVAWKCDRAPNGNLWHPGYKKALSTNDPRLFDEKKTRSGSEPTAVFKLDSFYEPYDPNAKSPVKATWFN